MDERVATLNSRGQLARLCPYLACLCLACLCLAWGCYRTPTADPQPAGAVAPGTLDLAVLRPQVDAFCGGCHAPPDPATFPKDGWFNEVERGYNFYNESTRTDLHPPVKRDVVEYYRSLAPAELPLSVVDRVVSERARQFRPEPIALEVVGQVRPLAVASLLWHTPAGEGQTPQLLISDMRDGNVLWVEMEGRRAVVRQQYKLNNPCRCQPTDLDGDGATDYVVADLGSFLPEDHQRGRVLWVRPFRAAGSEVVSPSEPVVLMDRLGRVADVRAGDFDADGDLDLVVAEFGWNKTGRVLLLENTGTQEGIPRFNLRVLDERHGAIHVPIVDIDQDGRLDFVALVSQEHETIDLFQNRGASVFERQTLFDARDPSFGSSGIELVDLDRDGDLDLLYTNGDTYDSYYLKPYHAVRWIENLGAGQWRHQELCRMPGVLRALAADLDGDGDLDVVACSLVPQKVRSTYDNVPLASLIWLEQTEPGTFVRHVLEIGRPQHATLEVGDFDGDGDWDVAVGNFEQDERTAVTIWWNELNPAK